KPDGKGHIPAAHEQAPGDDPAEDVHVNVAAGHQADHLFVLQGKLVEHGGGHSYGTGALGHQLLVFHKGQDGGSHLVVGNGDHIVHILLSHGEGDVAGSLYRNAVGKGVGGGKAFHLSVMEALGHAGSTGGL